MNWTKRLLVSSICAFTLALLAINVMHFRSTGLIIMDSITAFVLGWFIGQSLVHALILWNNYTFEYKGNKFVLKDKEWKEI